MTAEAERRSGGLRMTTWIKARASMHNGACVEVAPAEGGVMVRDSKDPRGPHLYFTAAEWSAFRDGVKTGEFDDLARTPEQPRAADPTTEEQMNSLLVDSPEDTNA